MFLTLSLFDFHFSFWFMNWLSIFYITWIFLKICRLVRVISLCGVWIYEHHLEIVGRFKILNEFIEWTYITKVSSSYIHVNLKAKRENELHYTKYIIYLFINTNRYIYILNHSHSKHKRWKRAYTHRCVAFHVAKDRIESIRRIFVVVFLSIGHCTNI